ncbi:MAG: hypothetical protein MRY83_00240, partial [Flavobacteriales bacterium]|nr:hypothetical protein [Flavobacteriales bacterium]
MTKLYIILAFCFLFCANWAEATVHIVTNTNDSGAGSLRNEIVNAGDGDTIMFDQSLVSDTIVLNSGQITIDKKLSIFGYSKANLMCISGNGISRIFHANLISEVYIKYLKLINGFSSTGGAILNNAFIKASYCRFIGNISNASSNSHGGGAIYVGSGSFAYLSHCEFIGNMAMAGLPNVAAYGAAIRNQGADLQIDNCTFSSNNTNSAHVSYGGAIYNGNICEIRNTTFSGNDVDGPNIARGGAIANQGNFTELMLDFCTFFDNESNGSQAFGGAIWN